MNVNIFKIFGEIAIKNEEANKAIDETVGKAEETSGKLNPTMKKIGTVVAGAFAVDKVKDFGAMIMKNSAEVQAENAQFDASFKELKTEATEAFDRVGEASGTLSSRLKTEGTKAFSQFKGSGLEANEALEKTEYFLQLATDASAYYDISLEDASQRIRSFTRGNVEAGDQIGLFTSESQRNQYALDKHGKKYTELTETQKQMLMLDVVGNIYKQSDAMGQAQRESESYSNTTGNLKETWRQFTAVLGAPLLKAIIPIMQGLTEKLIGAIEKVKEISENFQKYEGVIRAVGVVLGGLTLAFIAFKAGAMIQGVVNGFQNAQVALSLFSLQTGGATLAQGFLNGSLSFGEILVGLFTGKITLAQIATMLMTKAQLAMNAVMHANPIGLVILAIMALVVVFVILWNKSEAFRKFFTGLWKELKTMVGNIVKGIASIFTSSFDVIKKSASDIINGAWNIIKGVVDKIKSVFNFKWSLPKLKLPHFSVTGKFSLSPPSIPKFAIDWFAKGGVLNSPTMFGYNPATGRAQVGGEAGPEAVAPISTLMNYIRQAVGEQNEKSGKTIDVNINITGGDQLLDDYEFITKLKTIILTEVQTGNRTLPNRTSLIPIL